MVLSTRLFWIVALVFSWPAYAQVEWFVGSSELGDGNGRFATLERAVQQLKGYEAKPAVDFPAGGIRIHLSAGIHRLAEPVVITEALATEQGKPIVFLGPAEKIAAISGGRVLERGREVRDPLVLGRLPQRARGHVVQFDLRSQGISDLGPLIRRGFGRQLAVGQIELFFRGRPMTLARWPNEGYATVREAPVSTDQTRSFVLNGAEVKHLVQEHSLMATGYWGKDWADDTIPVESVDAGTGVITLQAPGPQFGILPGQRAFLQGALSELDSPGEWYLDRGAGILYFWPPAPIREGDVEVSILPSLVVTKGASHVRLSGITFESARGDALVIGGGTDVIVDNVTIRNVGGRAVVAAGKEHRFINIDAYDLGEGGFYLSGGDRQTLSPGGLSVENSRIRRFNRLSRTYRPAVQLTGVGNRAIGNVISEGTHSAIQFYGNDHLIAFNEIHDVAKETGDVGAIYTGRDWTARGTVIRNNYLHDIRGPGLYGSRGVYLDDQASGIVVRGNLFVRVDQPIFVGGGRDNRIEDNLMISSSPAIHVDARGLTWQRSLTEDPQGELRRRLSEVPFDRAPYRDRYPNLASILRDDTGAPKYNVIRRNVVVDSQAVRLASGAERWVKVDAMVEEKATLFRRGEAAQQSARPSDFANRFTSPPLEIMDCVASRWQQVDAGRGYRDCHAN